MARKSIETSTLKQLFALSGNKCAHPECSHPIFNDKGLYIAQLCHIEAANLGGARFNKFQTDSDRAKIENLLFMCYRHHKESDLYTKEQLIEIKIKHELQFKESNRNITNQMLNQVLLDINSFWQKLSTKEFENDDLKIKRKSDLDIFNLFEELYTHLSSISNLFKELEESDSKLSRYKNILELKDLAYCENPFVSRNFEIHSLAIPNTMAHTLLSFFQLRIKVVEELLKFDVNSNKLKKQLDEYRLYYETFYNES